MFHSLIMRLLGIFESTEESYLTLCRWLDRKSKTLIVICLLGLMIDIWTSVFKWTVKRFIHFLMSGHATSPQHTWTRVKAPDDDDDDDALKYEVMEEYTCTEKKQPVKLWFVHFTSSSTPAMGRQVQNWQRCLMWNVMYVTVRGSAKKRIKLRECNECLNYSYLQQLRKRHI